MRNPEMIFYSPLKDAPTGGPARNACVAGGQNPPTLPMGIGRAQLEELYVKQELSSRQTAKALGVSATLVLRILREKDLPVRTRQEALKTVWEKNKEGILALVQSPQARIKRGEARKKYFRNNPQAALAIGQRFSEARAGRRAAFYQITFGGDVQAGLRDLFITQGQSAAAIAVEKRLSKTTVCKLLVKHGLRQPGQQPARVPEDTRALVKQARVEGTFGQLPPFYQSIINARMPESGQPATLAAIGRELGVTREWIRTMEEVGVLFLQLQLHRTGLFEPVEPSNLEKPPYRIREIPAGETMATLYNVFHLSAQETAKYFKTRVEVIAHLFNLLGIQVKKGPRTRFERETATEYLSRVTGKQNLNHI